MYSKNIFKSQPRIVYTTKYAFENQCKTSKLLYENKLIPLLIDLNKNI